MIFGKCRHERAQSLLDLHVTKQARQLGLVAAGRLLRQLHNFFDRAAPILSGLLHRRWDVDAEFGEILDRVARVDLGNEVLEVVRGAGGIACAFARDLERSRQIRDSRDALRTEALHRRRQLGEILGHVFDFERAALARPRHNVECFAGLLYRHLEIVMGGEGGLPRSSISAL